jgi:RNA polymerase sigma-70 factor (ECF subfamily)
MALELDPTLLARATRGDLDALQEIVAVASPLIERQVMRYGLDHDEQRDLVQTTLMQVLRRLGSFRAESSFSTWLFRVTTNEALMLLRSKRRRRARLTEVDFEAATASHVAEGAEPDARLDARMARVRVATALAALPADYRDVVVAHYHEDLGLQEIAARLRISESAVRSRLHRARAALRTLLAA